MSNKLYINTIQIAKISSYHLLLFEQINKRQIAYLKVQQHLETGRKKSNLSKQHYAITFEQGWPTFKF